MSKKNRNNTATVNTVNATANTTTNEKNEGGITMSKNTTTSTTASTTTAKTMTAKEFKQASYDAYLSYVAFIEGKQDAATTVAALSPLMSTYGLTLTVDNLANLLTVKMTAFGKDKGEQAKKVKSIATFRAFVKGGWKDVKAAPVHSNAGKNPAETSSSRNSVTKADLLAANVALLKELETLRAAMASAKPTTETAPATIETATTEQAAA